MTRWRQVAAVTGNDGNGNAIITFNSFYLDVHIIIDLAKLRLIVVKHVLNFSGISGSSIRNRFRFRTLNRKSGQPENTFSGGIPIPILISVPFPDP